MKSVIHVYVDTKLEGLKKGFYILNKLLQANSPDVYARLRTERVLVDVFSAPWFLTCFSLAAQYDRGSENLRRIWDLIFAEGWIGFYKVTLAILT